MSAPTPTIADWQKAMEIVAAAPCPLTVDGVRRYIKSNSLGGDCLPDPILALAAFVRDDQMRRADEEWFAYTLWNDGHDQWGVTNPAGELRRVRKLQPHHQLWSAEGSPFMRVIWPIEHALRSIERRYAHRAEQVAQARPQPKHVWILRHLLDEAGYATEEQSRDCAPAH